MQTSKPPTPADSKQNPQYDVAILGAGSWGTAVAIHIAKAGFHVLLWSRDEQHAVAMQNQHSNERYLPGITFPTNLEVTHHLHHACCSAAQLIVAVPSHAFEGLLAQLPDNLTQLAWLTKGLCPSDAFLSELVVARYPKISDLALIAGPSFAKEVAAGMPTAILIASSNAEYGRSLQHYLHNQAMRAYLSLDLRGVEICGAVKNVVAIACGLSDGLGFGANARAALITRGLAEMRRLGLALGGQEDTFQGLAGLGDLVLTATDNQSRNRRMGLLLAESIGLVEAQKRIAQVVEGLQNVQQVMHHARKHRISMPICQAIYQLAYENANPRDLVNDLLQRPIGFE